MKVVNLQCPNCGARLTVENDMYVCNSCGTSIAIDYDDSDVEYEKLKSEPERQQRQLEHEKEMLEKEYELRQKETIAAEKRLRQQERRESLSAAGKKLIGFAVFILFLAGCVGFYIYMSKAMGRPTIIDEFNEMANPTDTPTPTPGPNYRITPEDIEDDLDDFIESGRIVQMNIDQCGVKTGNGTIHFYDKTDAVFLDAYIVSDIPDVNEKQACRLVLIYEVTWYNEDDGYHTCYDGVYFDGIKVTADGKIVSDYDGQTVWRSDAAWGWGMAYSFETYERCYLENVKALGGNVEEVLITYANNADTDVTDVDVADLEEETEEE